MRYFIDNLLYLLKIHATSLLFLTIFRLILFVAYQSKNALQVDAFKICHALLLGVWFDNVVACYVLILPAIVLCIISLFKLNNIVANKIIRFWTCVVFSFVFLICSANIPYFLYFFQNINSGIFQWFTYISTTVGMIAGDKTYLLYGLVFIFTVFVFSKIIYSFQLPNSARKQSNVCYRVITGLLCIVVIFAYIMGIRGRTGYNPIKVSQAYFCRDPFFNQLGISPAFNMITSIIDDMRPDNMRLNLISEKTAITNAQSFLNIKSNNGESLKMTILPKKTIHNGKNVVIIFMESMSFSLLNKGFTPFLDSLCKSSAYFASAYSSGNHTNHGVFSTLYSWPTILKRNAMKGSVVPQIEGGLPTVLKKNGYYNMFFMTHESQYDNMNAFLRTNGFDDIYSQESYPDNKVVNSFGVQDDFLFDFSIPIMNKAFLLNKQFLSVLLTVSNHPPYVVPQWFRSKSRETEKAIVEYADYSLRRFFYKARKQSWYNSTIFVLIGDHGKMVGNVECELPDCFNHIPLIIIGKDIPKNVVKSFALQIDVAPTILGMLGIGYSKYNLGIDLFNNKRNSAFYCGDKYLAARTEKHLYLFNPTDKKEHFYTLSNDKKLLQNCPSDSTMLLLRNYLFSMIQCSEYFYDTLKNKER